LVHIGVCVERIGLRELAEQTGSATTTGVAAEKRHAQYGSRNGVHYKSTLMMDKDIAEMGIKQ
jgi:hypothetical protein